MAPPFLRGNPLQVEWAGRIRAQVDDEFERVANVLQSVANHQRGSKRAATEAVIGILEQKRASVMSGDDAGYFIRDWQEIHDQVRQMIRKDPRYVKP
ncbi:MAG: hypothetical protein WDO18_10945 [Acidobacteriota bacterium]